MGGRILEVDSLAQSRADFPDYLSLRKIVGATRIEPVTPPLTKGVLSL
jgi:hypothetical protein